MVIDFTRAGRVVASLALACGMMLPAHAGEGPLNAQQLGILDRVVKFCGPVDPGIAEKLQAKMAELLKGASAATVAATRSSTEYHQGYDTMDRFVNQVDERNAKTLCTDSAKN